jgi:hypothetical protein
MTTPVRKAPLNVSTAPAEPVKLAVANGALMEVPIHETHERGSNWVAIIGIDPTKPGGLSRDFLDPARGECFYMVGALDVFDALEFAADYRTSRGALRRKRWFGVVMVLTEDYVILQALPTARQAISYAKEKRKMTSERVRSLQVTLSVLREKTRKIESEIAALEKGEAPAQPETTTPV